MNRFIVLRNSEGERDLINSRHIVTVEDMYDGMLQIRMINGLKYKVDKSEWDSIVGKDYIVQIAPLQDTVVLVSDGLDVVGCPARALALTATGNVRVLIDNYRFADFFDFESVKGVMSTEEYLKWKQDEGEPAGSPV